MIRQTMSPACDVARALPCLPGRPQPSPMIRECSAPALQAQTLPMILTAPYRSLIAQVGGAACAVMLWPCALPCCGHRQLALRAAVVCLRALQAEACQQLPPSRIAAGAQRQRQDDVLHAGHAGASGHATAGAAGQSCGSLRLVRPYQPARQQGEPDVHAPPGLERLIRSPPLLLSLLVLSAGAVCVPHARAGGAEPDGARAHGQVHR